MMSLLYKRHRQVDNRNAEMKKRDNKIRSKQSGSSNPTCRTKKETWILFASGWNPKPMGETNTEMEWKNELLIQVYNKKATIKKFEMCKTKGHCVSKRLPSIWETLLKKSTDYSKRVLKMNGFSDEEISILLKKQLCLSFARTSTNAHLDCLTMKQYKHHLDNWSALTSAFYIFTLTKNTHNRVINKKAFFKKKIDYLRQIM